MAGCGAAHVMRDCRAPTKTSGPSLHVCMPRMAQVALIRRRSASVAPSNVAAAATTGRPMSRQGGDFLGRAAHGPIVHR